MGIFEGVTLAFLVAISAVSFIFGYFQYKEKGVLLNNAFLFASKQERLKMNKKPYYRQSAIVFGTIGMIFAMNAAGLVMHALVFNYAGIALMFLLVVYAIVSTIRIYNIDK